MTRNQIDYLKLQEERRANLVNEYLTEKRDSRSMELKASELSEIAQHNRAVEDQAYVDLGIKEKNATSQRMTSQANLQNATSNTINAETNRFNADVNYQNALTNMRNAATNERNSDINAYNAESNRISAGAAVTSSQANLQQAGIAQLRQAEEARHNKVVEQQSRRQISIESSTARSQRDLNKARAEESRAEVDLKKSRASDLSSQMALREAQIAEKEANIDLLHQQYDYREKSNPKALYQDTLNNVKSTIDLTSSLIPDPFKQKSN